MRHAGIDIGSRTIELVVLENGHIVESGQTDTGFDPMARARELLNGASFDRIMATGYGRNLFEIAFDAPTVTEIKAYGVGVHSLIPGAENHPGYRGTGQQGHLPERNGRREEIRNERPLCRGDGKIPGDHGPNPGF